MKIAIVGAQESKWTVEQKEKAREKIKEILLSYLRRINPRISKRFDERCWTEVEFTNEIAILTIISGHCPKGGVDIWVEEIADELGISKIIYKPEINSWKDQYGISNQKYAPKWKTLLMGYKSRNEQIARTCNILYDIEPKGKRSGGTWTLEYAKGLGKEVHKIEIE